MGWWKVEGTEDLIGDSPLERLVDAVEGVVDDYERAFGRRPSRREWEALLLGALGGEPLEAPVLDDGIVNLVSIGCDETRLAIGWPFDAKLGSTVPARPFIVRHRSGANERSTDPQIFSTLLAKLDGDGDGDGVGDEHVCVSVRLHDGWTLGAYVSGLVVFENVEDTSIEPRHVRGQTRDEARRRMELLVRGGPDAVEREEWRPGYGS